MIGALCLNLLNGTCLVWGTISVYVVSHIYMAGDQSASFKKGVLIIPLNLIFSGIMYPVGAYLQPRVNPKIIIATGCTILLISLYMASMA